MLRVGHPELWAIASHCGWPVVAALASLASRCQLSILPQWAQKKLSAASSSSSLHTTAVPANSSPNPSPDLHSTSSLIATAARPFPLLSKPAFWTVGTSRVPLRHSSGQTPVNPQQPSTTLQQAQDPLDAHNSIVVNGRRVKTVPGQTVLQAAASAGVFIPSLCYHPRLPKSPGTCRVCLVSVDGRMKPACATEAQPGQQVETDTEEVRRHVSGQLAFLRSNHPDDCMVCDVNGRCEFQRLIDQYQVPLMPKTARIQQHAAQLQHFANFADPLPAPHWAPPQPHDPPCTTPSEAAACTAASAATPAPAPAPAQPQEGSGHWGEAGAVGGTCAIKVDLDKCIKCGRCVTMCQDVQGMDVLGWVGRGSAMHVGVIEEVELAQSKCIECGQCVSVCPVGALTEAPQWRQVLELLRGGRKVMVAQTAPAVRVAIGEEVGLAPGSVSTGQLVAALRQLGFQKVFDTNFSADLTIVEEGTELLHRLAYHWTHPPTTSPATPTSPPATPTSQHNAPTTNPSPDPQAATANAHATHPAAATNLQPTHPDAPPAATPTTAANQQAHNAPAQNRAAQEEAQQGAHYPGPLPMFTSCCPAWVADVEKRHPQLVPYLSSCRSPQAMLGSVVKHVWANKVGIPAEDVVLVSIMPCVAKKHEAAREELLPPPCAPHPSSLTESHHPPASTTNNSSIATPVAGTTAGLPDNQAVSTSVATASVVNSQHPDVDYVLTTRELGMMLRHVGVPLASLPEQEYDHPLGSSTGAAALFGATGGVMEAALRTVHALVGAPPLPQLEMEAIRGLEGVREAVLPLEGPGVPGGSREVRVAIASGIGAAEKLLERMMAGQVHYDFVEVMACPGGCIGGGGQPKTKDPTTIPRRLGAIYSIDEGSGVRMSHLNPDVQQLYDEALGQPGGQRAHELLHTHYSDKSKDVV